MKKALCILTVVLMAAMFISNCSNCTNPENMGTTNFVESELSGQNNPDTGNVSDDSSSLNNRSVSLQDNKGLDSICKLRSAILDSCKKDKNWVKYAQTLMKFGPIIDDVRSHMVGLDEYPYEKSACRYIPFYSEEQILRIRGEGREDLAEQYIGINEAKELLCN